MAIPENLTIEQYCDVIASEMSQTGNMIRAIRPQFPVIGATGKTALKTVLENILTAEKVKIDGIISAINAVP